MLSRRMLERQLRSEVKKSVQVSNRVVCTHCKKKDLLIAALRLQLRLTSDKLTRRKAREHTQKIVTESLDEYHDRELDRQAIKEGYQRAYENLSSI